MDALYDILPSLPPPESWLPLLAACTWKSLVLLGAAWLVTRTLLRGASAAARHWVWGTALACVLMLPALMVAMPGWTVPLPHVELPAVAHSWQQTEPSATAAAPEAPTAPAASTPALPGAPAPAAAPALPPLPELNEAAPTPTAAAAAEPKRTPWALWALGLWIFGAAVVFGYFIVGSLRAWRWGRRSDPVEDAEWQALMLDLSWQLDLRRRVHLAWSDRPVTPMTRGVLRPEVLLPRSAHTWPAERRRVVLLHELAHVERWDTLTQVLAQVACALYWFNPLVWWSTRQMQAERERACDDRVLTLGTRASTYAEHLLEIARSFRTAPGMPLGAVSMARKSQLEGRLLAILEPGLRRRAHRAVTVVTGVLFVAAVLPLAAMRPQGDDPSLWAFSPENVDLLAAHASSADDTAQKPHEVLKSEVARVPGAPAAPKPKAASGIKYQYGVQNEQHATQQTQLNDGMERTVTRRTFAVEPGGTLGIESDRGSIEVASGNGSEVRVEVIREGDEDEIDRFRLGFAQNGDDVRVRGDYDQHSSWLRGDDLRVRFVVTVPRRYNVNLQTSGGSIAVDDLTGRVDAKTSGGSLRFGDIEGPVRGKTSGGSITLEGSTGNAWLNTSGGSIRLGDIDGDVEAHTSGGSISIGAVRGTVEAKTSGGSINVEEVAGDIDASTSGGSVRARITEQPKGQCRLTTSGGSVTVSLAGGVAMDVDARTSHGRVTTDFDVPESAFDEEHEELKAAINGGGPELYLRTSAGRIRIERISGGRGSLMPQQQYQQRVETEWQLAVEEAVQESREAMGEARVEAQQATQEALHEMLAELDGADESTWFTRTLAHAAVELLEKLAYDRPRVEVSVDGHRESICLLQTLADLPDDAGLPALYRLAERHDDPDVQRHARELITGREEPCPEDEQKRTT